MTSSSSNDVAEVWRELDDGTFAREYASYQALFNADLELAKGRAYDVKVYQKRSLSGPSTTLDASKVHRANASDACSVPDMTALTHLDEPNMLECLRQRYVNNEIYTNISTVLVAINPYQHLGLYTRDWMRKYRRQKRLNLLPPHVFSVAEQAYQELMWKLENQSMVCCGESGSGKTESTKMLMRYLANVTNIRPLGDGGATGGGGVDGDDDEFGAMISTSMVEEQVLQANPVLEAFGNARTNMNDNSSRFAKFTKLFFSTPGKDQLDDNWRYRSPGSNEGRILGANTETYLLERSRVVRVGRGERNFHIFYQLCAAANDERVCSELESSMGIRLPSIQPANRYTFLASGGVTTLDGVSDAERFEELQSCMSTLGVDIEQQQACFDAVAAIALLGNVEFHGADVSNESMVYVEQAAVLLGLTTQHVINRLTMRTVKVRTEVYEKPLAADDVVPNRDAVAKALYNAMFNWVVGCINDSLYVRNETGGEGDDDDDDNEPLWIGILDVFGFECFQYNSFEQFCINYANETLQQFFNECILKSEQNEYRKEGIFWVPIDIPDNDDVISLISSKPSGMLCLLDSACIMPKATAETFHTNLMTVHRRHKRLKAPSMQKSKKASSAAKATAAAAAGGRRRGRRSSVVAPYLYAFEVSHFAGPVTYDAKEFLAKNADQTHADTVVMFGESTNPLLPVLFADELEDINAAAAAAATSSSRRRGGGGGGGGGGRALRSVGSRFAQQLGSLMRVLRSTTPYFIRCANPNDLKASETFHPAYIRPQLRCGGLVEALRMLKMGYPSRVKYDVIYDTYGSAMRTALPENLNRRNFCEAILVALGLGASQYQLGITKVFFRAGKQEFLQSVFRRSKEPLTVEMERVIRRWLVKRRMDRFRGAVSLCVGLQRRINQQRAAKHFRTIVRGAVIYRQTLHESLYTVRRRHNLKLCAVDTISGFWLHAHIRQGLQREFAARARQRKQQRRFAAAEPKVDTRTQEELATMKLHLKRAREREDAEKRKLTAIQEEARQKEATLQREAAERKREVEQMKRELDELKVREQEREEQERVIEQLKAHTEQMKRESASAVEQAQLVIEQQELDFRRKEQELLSSREAAEQRRVAAEHEVEELARQREEERALREQELRQLQEQTERMKAEEEVRLAQAREVLQQREEQARAAARELEDMARSKTQVSDDLKKQLDEARLSKEEERVRINEEIFTMRQDLETRAMRAQLQLESQERENTRREQELAVLRDDSRRLEDEHRRMRMEMEEQRMRERLEREDELRRMKEASEQTRVHYENELRRSAELLRAQEEEHVKRADALHRVREEADASRRQQQAAMERAETELLAKEEEAAKQIELLHTSLALANQSFEVKQRQLQEEAKAELEVRLRLKDDQSKMAMDELNTRHDETIKELEQVLVVRDEEIELLNDEVQRLDREHSAEKARWQTEKERLRDEVTRRDEMIAQMQDEMDMARKANDEVQSISTRLLDEQAEEFEKKEVALKRTLNVLKKKVNVGADAQGKQKPGASKGLSRFGFKRELSLSLGTEQKQQLLDESKRAATAAAEKAAALKGTKSAPQLKMKRTSAQTLRRTPSKKKTAATPVKVTRSRPAMSMSSRDDAAAAVAAEHATPRRTKPQRNAVARVDYQAELTSALRAHRDDVTGVSIKKTDKTDVFMFGSRRLALVKKGGKLQAKVDNKIVIPVELFFKRFAAAERRKVSCSL